METQSDIAAIRETFVMERFPANVCAAQQLGRRMFLRRFSRFALGGRWFSPEGSFTYHAHGGAKTVRFDGRNLQFRALYDEMYRNGYEVETGLLMKKLCRGSGAFWDVGANWGYFSLLAAAFPAFTGAILAFEPNPNSFHDLTSVVDQAGLSGRIQTLNQGASAKAGEMVVAEVDRFNSGLTRLKTGGDGQKIPVVTLDSVAAAPPQFIKVDAEGMELEVLQGAAGVIRQARPFIVFENLLETADAGKTFAPVEFLRGQGYRIFIPVLRFSIGGRAITATYGHDYNPLFATDPAPVLGLYELQDAGRFLLAWQLNLLGVHASRVLEVEAAGIQQISLSA